MGASPSKSHSNLDSFTRAKKLMATIPTCELCDQHGNRVIVNESDRGSLLKRGYTLPKTSGKDVAKGQGGGSGKGAGGTKDQTAGAKGQGSDGKDGGASQAVTEPASATR